MENHSYAPKMQKEMISEIESARPKFLVYVRVSTSWLVRPNSQRLIFKWFGRYRRKYYRKVGIIDIFSEHDTTYVWGPECRQYKPRSKYTLSVFQRSD